MPSPSASEPGHTGLRPRDAVRAVVGAAIAIAVTAVAIAALSAGKPQVLLTLLLSQAIIAAAAWLTVRGRGVRLQTVVCFAPPPPRSLAAGSLAGAGVLLVSGAAIMRLAPWIGDAEGAAGAGIAALLALLGPAGMLLVFVCLVPLAEELLFRGVVLEGLAARFRPAAANGMSAALFGLYHVQPLSALAALLLGLVCGWAVQRSGSWWTGVVVHAVNNAIVVGGVLAAPDAGTAPLAWAWLPIGILAIGLGVRLLEGSTRTTP